MDDHVALNDLFFKLLNFLLVHRLNFIVPLKVRFLEVLELPLEFFELPVDSFIVSRQILVDIFELLIFFFVLLSEVEVPIVENRFFLLELFVVFVVLFFLFLEDLQIVVQFFSVQLVKSLHLFVAFLQVLDIVLHLYLSGGVGLHTLYPQFFYGFFELLFLLFSAHCEFLLHFDMPLEALFNFVGGFL